MRIQHQSNKPGSDSLSEFGRSCRSLEVSLTEYTNKCPATLYAFAQRGGLAIKLLRRKYPQPTRWLSKSLDIIIPSIIAALVIGGIPAIAPSLSDPRTLAYLVIAGGLIVNGTDGGIYSTWWDANGGWANWFNVSGGAAALGALSNDFGRAPTAKSGKLRAGDANVAAPVDADLHGTSLGRWPSPAASWGCLSSWPRPRVTASTDRFWRSIANSSRSAA